jgi:hypothetical protein
MSTFSLAVALIVFLTLIVWRVLFAGLQRSRLTRETGVPQQANNSFWDLEAVAAIAGSRFGNNRYDVDLFERKDRAKIYLGRIVALTGATQVGNTYVLEVGTTRFQVRERYVRRLRDISGSKCTYEETCYCLPYSDIPKTEQIASALLQLKNNPALFDRWAAQSGAFKADGQGFSRAQ